MRLGVIPAALASAALVTACASETDDPAAITVAAASDLRPAFEELGRVFTERTGTEVTFSFGSSGLLREQVLDGAPFDLYASADVTDIDEVIAAGRGDAATRSEYATGRIVLWTPSGVDPPSSIETLTDATWATIAIANPQHAPYGRAARDALRSAGVLDDVEGRVVYGESVIDAFRIARSRNADVGIIARSLAVSEGGASTLVPAELHPPLRQALVVTGSGERADAAARFAETISSAAGQEVLQRYGFEPAGTGGGD